MGNLAAARTRINRATELSESHDSGRLGISRDKEEIEIGLPAMVQAIERIILDLPCTRIAHTFGMPTPDADIEILERGVSHFVIGWVFVEHHGFLISRLT